MTLTETDILKFQAARACYYDLTPVPRTGMTYLNFSRLDNYFRRYKIDFSNENEERIGFASLF